MAQIIKLRRSTIEGKVPTTSSMVVGEVALNTYDGRAFLYKSGSAQSIEQLVVTNSETTGSITILGTGSFGELNITNDINLSGSIFGLGDVVVNGDIDALGNITGSNLLVYGTITARQLVISSSVTNMITQTSSGSTAFGDSINDTHLFTGSVRVSGSVTATSFSGDGAGLTGVIVDLSTAQLNSVDGNSIPARSFAELYVACAVSDIVDLDFGV